MASAAARLCHSRGRPPFAEGWRASAALLGFWNSRRVERAASGSGIVGGSARRAAGEQEVERDAQAVNVGPDVGGLAVEGLLGRDVVRRADRVAGAELAGQVAVVAGGARQTEVEDFHQPGALQQQVGRLDVAV